MGDEAKENVKTEPKIMYDSDEAAQLVTVTGWRSKDGIFYGNNEHIARWAGCTHMVCECGTEHPKGRTMCDDCFKKKRDAKYQAMPTKEWEGEPLCLHDDETYFWSEDQVTDWCDDNGVDPATLQLVICEPQYAGTLDGNDIFRDALPEDQYLEDRAPILAAAFDALNKVIEERAEILCWMPGKYRTCISIKKAIETV
jgi:hypothetical protein